MRKTTNGIIGGLVMIGLAWFVWEWGFCRFYVYPGEMAVITAQIGNTLPPGQILAGKGQKGIQEEVLGEGRHFLNPILYRREIRDVVLIPAGRIGIVTSKLGKDLPEGEFLADPDQKGIWRQILGPGKYRLNTYGYTIEIVDAISIPIGYAGVVTSLSGEQTPGGEFAEQNQKGVRKDILQPGLYYVNPKRFKVDVLEIGVNQVSLLGKTGGEVHTKGQLATQNVAMEELQSKMLEQQKRKRLDYLSEATQTFQRPQQAPAQQQRGAQQAEQARALALHKTETMTTFGLAQFLEFPSRDGFQISLDMTVEVELVPKEISWIFSRYGDLPAVVDKIIMPQITSIARNKGSEYGAKDFIIGEGREKFQMELTRALAATLELKKILVHNALIRHVEVPEQILTPIQDASIAVEQDLTNKEKQNTARKLAELNTEMSLIEQKHQQVLQETEKLKAEVKADQQKQVAEIAAQAMKQVAEIETETAGIRADITRTLGTADADALRMVDGEKANGLQLKTKAFGDTPAFNLWEFAQNLNEKVKINVIHTGPGTLWTDLDKARAGDLGGAVILQGQQQKK